MSDLRIALDELREAIEALPSHPTGDDIRELEKEARTLLTQSKNTPFEDEARELFSQLARMEKPSSGGAESGQVRSLLRRARIRIEIAGDDHDFDEAIDILAQALDLDPENAETHELLLQASQRSTQHAVKVQGLVDRYGLELEESPSSEVQQDSFAASLPPRSAATSSEPTLNASNADEEGLLTEVASTYYAGDYERTVDLANRLLATDPDNVQANDYRQKAEDNLMRGAVPDHRIPFDARVAYNRANSLVRAGNYDEAQRLYREAREIAERAGIQSWKDVEQALLEIQDLALARELLADGDRLLAADDWSGALSKYEGALRVVPNDPEAEDRVGLVRKVQEQFDQASVQLSMATGTLTERAENLVDLLNMLANIRQTLPGSSRLQQMMQETNTRILNVKTQLVSQGESALARIEAASAIEEKYRLAHEARGVYQSAVELDPSDAKATAGLRQAEQISAELNEGRQVMERSAALMAQNFDNELAQARQMLAGLRHNAQDPRYRMLVGDLLARHIERVEMAIDRKDIETANRWLATCKEDPFRILGRRTEILRLEDEIRSLQQGRLFRRLLVVAGVLLIVVVLIFFTWDSGVGAVLFPTDTPLPPPTSTASPTTTGTATNTATTTPTATETPLPPEQQTATEDALVTFAAETQAAIAAQTSTEQRIQLDQEETIRAINLTASSDAFNSQNTITAAARTQQASETNVALTEVAQATRNWNNTQTATNRPPSNTPRPTNTPTLRPSPTEQQSICIISNPGPDGVNIRLRRTTGAGGTQIGTMEARTTAAVYAVERGIDDPQTIWYQVQIEDDDGEIIEGWVSATVVDDIQGFECPEPSPLDDE